jgi:hypothetical protein
LSNLQKIVLGFFLILISLLVYIEATKPVPLNWFPSYSKVDKIPMGTYVIYDVLKQHFNDNLVDVSIPPYIHLRNEDLNGTYLFINNHIGFDKTELESLLSWAGKGNTVFLAANNYSKNLLDTLGLEISYAFFYNRFATQPLLNLVNENLKASTPYHIEKNMRVSYFNKIDTLTTHVLGFSQAYEDEQILNKPEANFIKVPFEEGNLYLYNQPEIFTNFFLLDEKNNSLTSKVLSYINTDSSLYWDNYYKTGRRVDISPLHILFSTKSLKWAYYLLLIGVILFVFFEGKRKQRSIPVVAPLTNKTFEYTQTISQIYLENNDNKAIAKKMVVQFLEYIRIKLRVQTDQINKRFFEEVSLRSSNETSETISLFETIKKTQESSIVSDNELEELHKKISQFKSKTDGKH